MEEEVKEQKRLTTPQK